jgi:uncharacterized protein YmfQ (DUF2313 family)
MSGNSVFSRLLSCFATELNRLDDHVLSLIRNGIPGLSDEAELLPDWETDLGLPEPCFPLGLTEIQRRIAAQSKYTTKYTGLSEQFFIDLADSYGAAITITTGGGAGTPFRASGPTQIGVTRVGPTTPASDPGSRVWSVAQLHIWIINIAGSEPNLDLIICQFERLKPAQTIVQFNIS